MTLTVDIPDDLAHQMTLDQANGARRVLEGFLVERYNANQISAGQLGKALGMGFNETEQFLKDHGAVSGLALEETLHGVKNLQKAMAESASRDAPDHAPPVYPDFVERARQVWGNNPPGPLLSEIVSEMRG